MYSPWCGIPTRFLDVNDDQLLVVAFVIHIVELVLHLLSLLPSLVFTHLLVGKPVFQINIRIFMWNILVAFYMQWAVRTAIFALTFAEVFEGKRFVLGQSTS